MRIQKQDIPTRIDAPGAIARQLPNFGTASGTLGAEYFSLGAGADLAPLLVGLHDNLCQSAHWGYVISGAVVVTFADATAENCATGDVFFWPPGHTVRVEENAELILFSPQDEHGLVMDHIKAAMGLTS